MYLDVLLNEYFYQPIFNHEAERFGLENSEAGVQHPHRFKL